MLSTVARRTTAAAAAAARGRGVATVAQFAAYGPATSTRVTVAETKPAAPGAKQVAVRMTMAPVNPSDVAVVEGMHGELPSTLPAVGGSEGVGVVSAVGAGVSGVKAGERVVVAAAGTWCSEGVFAADAVFPVPDGVRDEDAAVAATAPCAALRMLDDFGGALGDGDVLLQNGGTSMVASAVIQLAKARGVRTVSVVRPRPDGDETVERMKEHGADVVVDERYAGTAAFRKLMAGMPAPSLALNGVGGASATELARALAPGGTLVTYGAVSRRPLTLPSSLLLHRGISATGFSLARWARAHSRDEYAATLATVLAAMADGRLRLWTERHDWRDFSTALARSQQAYKARKVLLQF